VVTNTTHKNYYYDCITKHGNLQQRADHLPAMPLPLKVNGMVAQIEMIMPTKLLMNKSNELYLKLSSRRNKNPVEFLDTVKSNIYTINLVLP